MKEKVKSIKWMEYIILYIKDDKVFLKDLSNLAPINRFFNAYLIY